jgi:ribosomal protein S18 acetylase RimI-like enzyme
MGRAKFRSRVSTRPRWTPGLEIGFPPRRFWLFPARLGSDRERGVEVLVADSSPTIALVRELFREYAASLPVDLGYQDFEREVAGLPGEYAGPSGTLRIAVEAGRPLGCVAVRPLELEICEMKRLYVRAEARGLGLGRTLAETAIAFAGGAGYRAMRLDTLPTMSAARELYRRLGFREIPRYRFSPVAGNVYLERALTPRPDPPGSGRSGLAD